MWILTLVLSTIPWVFPICYLGTEIFFFDLVKSLAIFSRNHKLFCFINDQTLQISSRWLCLTYILVSCCVTDVSVKNPPLIYLADSFKTSTSRSLIYSIYEISVVAKLETSHVLQGNKNKNYRGRGKCLSVSIVKEMWVSLTTSHDTLKSGKFFTHKTVIIQSSVTKQLVKNWHMYFHQNKPTAFTRSTCSSLEIGIMIVMITEYCWFT